MILIYSQGWEPWHLLFISNQWCLARLESDEYMGTVKSMLHHWLLIPRSSLSKLMRSQKLTLHWAKSYCTGTAFFLALLLFPWNASIQKQCSNAGSMQKGLQMGKNKNKMARSFEQSHLTGKSQHNLPDDCFRNAPSGQHEEDTSSF